MEILKPPYFRGGGILLMGLLILFFTGSIIKKPWDRDQTLLFRQYNREDLETISFSNGMKIQRREQSWMLQDEQGGLWPVDKRALEELINLPTRLVYHPLSKNPQAAELPHWESPVTLEYLDQSRKVLLTLQLGGQPDAGGFLFADETGLLHLNQVSTPSVQLQDYLALSPWQDLDPQDLIVISLNTDLQGQGAEYFNYSLMLEDSTWRLMPQDKPVEPSIMTEQLNRLVNLQAISLLNRDDVDIPGHRFTLSVRDRNNASWILNVADPLELQGNSYWPALLEGSDYIYLFRRQDLAEIARSSQSLLAQ
ncbi:MAG: hypothetical protein PF447_05915 [Spirochaetaceae bacterium]|jgi:hypothetical protein|nr:hypothetical protein [Spirochaetaceae bacterium]